MADCNSKYFHAYASARKKKNSIRQLKDSSGNRKEWNNGLEELIGAYYDNLFQSRGSDMQEILEGIDVCINQAQNEELIQKFTDEEVRDVIFSMHPDKSPGPDGMNPAFYQRFWNIIGPDTVKECRQILSSGKISQNLNDTLVVLIPKKTNPEVLTDLRPISLCNVLIKIITKMLANRMKNLCRR